MARLTNGDRFPTMVVDTLQEGTLRIPDEIGDRWGVVLIYRGDW